MTRIFKTINDVYHLPQDKTYCYKPLGKYYIDILKGVAIPNIVTGYTTYASGHGFRIFQQVYDRHTGILQHHPQGDLKKEDQPLRVSNHD